VVEVVGQVLLVQMVAHLREVMVGTVWHILSAEHLHIMQVVVVVQLVALQLRAGLVVLVVEALAEMHH
jgi:hypothetical protein